ncbi:MAG: survival protein SurE [Actinobacteria bacterium]|nr:survival protein SurE [Actinomycetota bacterium]
MSSKNRALLARLASAAVLLVGCADDGGEAATDEPAETTAPQSDEATAASASDGAESAASPSDGSETLVVLVSNDDGIASEGIDAVVNELSALEDVEVLVYAPAEQQSGQGGKFTEGGATAEPGQTRSGVAGVAVNGFPADAVNYAFDVDGVKPHVVISGMNHGANLGAFVEVSGTVGAARSAVRRGVPALASSMGSTDTVHWDLGATFVTDWVREHRDALLAGTAPVEVVNLNVPTCAAGEVRGAIEVATDYQASDASMLAANCTSTEAAGDSDIVAFSRGYVTWSVLSTEPTPNLFSTAG